MQQFVILAWALVLGMAHAFEVDHLAAVTAFVARKPTFRQAGWFGLQWSIGHGLSLLILGLTLHLLRTAISDAVAGWIERLVGAALLALGLYLLREMHRAGLSHDHGHHHPPEPATGEGHWHRHAEGTYHCHSQAPSHSHGSLLMGLLHGVAGTAAFIGQTLTAVSSSLALVIGFTLAFNAGVLIAMTIYAGLMGKALSFGQNFSHRLLLGARVLTALWACGVGVFWIVK